MISRSRRSTMSSQLNTENRKHISYQVSKKHEHNTVLYFPQNYAKFFQDQDYIKRKIGRHKQIVTYINNITWTANSCYHINWYQTKQKKHLLSCITCNGGVPMNSASLKLCWLKLKRQSGFYAIIPHIKSMQLETWFLKERKDIGNLRNSATRPLTHSVELHKYN